MSKRKHPAEPEAPPADEHAAPPAAAAEAPAAGPSQPGPSQPKSSPPEPAEVPPPPTGTPPGGPSDAAPAAAPTAAEARVAELEAEAAALKDRLLRALAETENVRRRAEREREDTRKFAVAAFAREMLSVPDNLHRALASVPAEARRADAALENLMVGIELTESQMMATLERTGIRRIEALGQRFDPHLHEAMLEIEDKGRPAGTVVQVLEAGYTLNDRLLRPAKVAVGRGGPPAPPRAANDAGSPPTGKAPVDEAAAPPKDAAPETAAKPDAGQPKGPAKGATKAYDKPADASGTKLDEKL